jgi:tetratricopeptide (TPR) repeat protein
MLEGNYHIALQELAQCEQEYAKASQPREVVLCQLDRAEAYLGLNLFADAGNAARKAEKGAQKLGIEYESAKAALFSAKASFALGRKRRADLAMKRAAAGFQKERNQSFLAATEFLSAQIEPDNDSRVSKMVAARRKLTRAQLPLWEAMCDLQFLSERPEEASALKRLSKNRAVKTVPHLRARRQTMLGDMAAKRGRMEPARKHWTQAADILDAVRAKLPPVDMRTAFTRHRNDPHLKLVRSNLADDTLQAAAWSERYRTAGLWTVADEMFQDSPERVRAEKALAELAHRVTTLSGQLVGPDGRRTGIALSTGRALSSLQNQVRHDLAALDQTDEKKTYRIETLCDQLEAASRRQPIIQFHSDGNDIVAFIHDRGETRQHCYVDGARAAHEYMGRWRFLVERAAYSKDSPRASDISDECGLLTQIGDWLWAPLEVSVHRDHVLVLPDGQVSNLPWQAIIHNGLPLGASHQIHFSPSLRHHLHARGQCIRSRRIRVFVGTTEGLSHTRRDYSVLVARGGDAVEVHEPCRRQDWPNESRARIWHYAGHAQLRSDNAFYSSLLLSDGPLFAADLRLKRNDVGLVTLAACRTGQQAYLPGEESTGLVRSFLEMGARNVIASQWAVSDDSTALWMNKFYEGYLTGGSVGRAAREAMLTVRDKYPAAYHWAAFSAYGAG